MRIAVMGAGIAGLTLVHELRRRGLTDVLVLERAQHFEHVGAGIHIGSWGATILDANGIGAMARARGVPYRARRYLNRYGDTVGVVNHADIAARHGGVTGFFLHRADLHEVLVAGVNTEQLHNGVHVVSAEQEPGRVRIQTQDHGRHEVDLLVGCDGLHSQVREFAFGGRSQPSGLGRWAARIVLPADPTLTEFEVYRGIGSSIGLAPLNAEQMYLWFTSTTDGGHRSVDHPRSGADLVRLLRSYPAPRIADLCERIDPSHAPLVADLYEVTVEPWWSGRMVLCGDAAHAMSPSTGSGGTMAMEDAFVLARALATVAEGNASLEAALDSYYRERLPRVESMRLRTRMASYTNTLPTEELCRLRDERDRILLADPDAHAFEVTDALDPNA